MKIEKKQRKNVFLFAGQGSQYFNMAKSLYETNSVFQENMDRLDEKFYRLTNEHMIKILYGSDEFRNREFNCTRYTHPCIYMTEYSIAKMLIEKGIYPDFVMGTSLGEVAAANIANVLSDDDAVITVASQSLSIDTYCQAGGMLAILSSYHIYEEWDLFRGTELAAINYDEHFVISGTVDEVKRVESQLKKKKIVCIPIPVTHAFHSSLINNAKQSYLQKTANVVVHNPEIQMISCITGDLENPDLAEYFWKAIREPIQFQKALENIKQQGEFNFIDVSIGGSLAAFTKHLVSLEDKKRVFFIESPFQKAENVLPKLLEMLSTE